MLTAAGITALVAMCIRLECDPVDLISVAANESNISTTAHNPNGDASGLWQLMPATAKGLGWDVDSDPHLSKFRALSDVDQMKWFERYFAPHKGQLVSGTAVYMATFCPAWMSHALDPSFVICGVKQQNPRLNAGQNAIWYKSNRGFDTANKGYIVVQDLYDAIERATTRMGAAWTNLVAEIRAAQTPPPCSDAA